MATKPELSIIPFASRDAWVATADAESGTPYLVLLSFL